MNAFCRAYDNTADAERAARALLAGGVPGAEVRLLAGAEMHDARREPGGGFAGPIASQERVGAFAGKGHSRGAPHGGFAGEGASGPEGVFGNADRDVVVTYPDGREHSRVAGHRSLKRLLIDAGLDDDAAESDIRDLHDGRVLLLVTLGTVSADRADELIAAGS